MKWNILKLKESSNNYISDITNGEMTTTNSEETSLVENNIALPKKQKKKVFRRNIVVTLSACITILAVFFIFAYNYDIPLPFDAYRMSVELVPHAIVTNEDGSISWIDPDYVETDNYNNIINVLTRVYRGINGISEMSFGKTINRNGKNIRVVYYYYSKTLWNSLFVDPDLQEYSESGMSTGTDLYGDSFETLNHAPQMVEIYYLPVKGIYDKMEHLSDEEYDQLRENRMLVWSGMI